MRKLLCYILGHKWKRIGWHFFGISKYSAVKWRCKICRKEKYEDIKEFP